MRNPRRQRVCQSLTLWLLAAVVPLATASELPQLIRRGQLPLPAQLQAVGEDGNLVFLAGEDTVRIPVGELVRWSTPVAGQQKNVLVLRDGSRISIASTWTGQPDWQLSAATVSVATDLFRTLRVPLGEVRAVLLNIESTGIERTKQVDRILSSPTASDRAYLSNGDVLPGKVLTVATPSGGAGEVAFRREGGENPLTIPGSRVAALVFQRESLALPLPRLVVGLRDGSSLVCRSLQASGEKVRPRLVCGIELPELPLEAIQSLQAFTSDLVYLSDLEPANFEHQPYLSIDWPFTRDRNVLGGKLTSAKHTYDKGLGVHSASRLTYSLAELREAGGNPTRLAAEVALDDAAQPIGSVVFRVLLRKDGAWETALTSPTVRGGDPPIPIVVELAGADQVALDTDYADRGDQRDYANWLDARLE